MYLPPDDLAVQFRSSAVLMAEYEELHRAYILASFARR
jgi:hypothetical protein